MKKHLIVHLLIFAFVFNAKAQSNIDTVLTNIAKNNKTILANKQYWEAQKVQFKTGLTPYNPAVNYDFMFGSPSTAGDQTDFTLTQAIDFPTAYFKKKQLAARQMEQTEIQHMAKRQDILLEARITCIDLIYHNKLQLQLKQRKTQTEKLLSDFQTKLDKGEGNILDVNKAQLQHIEINKEFQQNTSLINQLNQKLTELNGGNAMELADTMYPLLPIIPTFEQLENEIEKNDPIRKYLEQEKLVNHKQVELAKAMSLPKLEAGYHYQGILGQTFQGVHFGFTLPLWENKNRVKMQQSKLLFTDLELEDHRNEHYYEIKMLYEKYTNLKITIEQYKTFFSTLNNTLLLNKSLALGQISAIEYFMEISFYNSAFSNYLQTEKEYYDVISTLYKYQL